MQIKLFCKFSQHFRFFFDYIREKASKKARSLILRAQIVDKPIVIKANAVKYIANTA